MLKIYLKVIGTIIVLVLLGVQVWLDFTMVKSIQVVGTQHEITKQFIINSFPEQVKAFNDAQQAQK